MRLVDHIAVTVGLIWPFVGVLWLEWDIGNTIFVYSAEAAIIVIYHIILYWRTSQLFTDPDIRLGYKTAAVLRVCAEGLVVGVALMTFIDFAVGRHVAAAFHVDALGSYVVASIVPIAALLLHYGQRLRTPPTPTIILPIGWWLLYYPLPLFVCSYVLVSTTAFYLPGLLLVIILCKAIVEYRLLKPLPELSQAPRDHTVLTGHPLAQLNCVRQGAAYLVVGVGMMSVNPFFFDPRFTLFENAVIFLGFALIWLSVVRQPKVRLELNDGQILWEQLGWIKIRRTIPIADITKIKGVVNTRVHPPQLAAHIFTIKNQRRWRLGPFYLLRSDWLAWLQMVQRRYPDLEIPYL